MPEGPLPKYWRYRLRFSVRVLMIVALALLGGSRVGSSNTCTSSAMPRLWFDGRAAESPVSGSAAAGSRCPQLKLQPGQDG